MESSDAIFAVHWDHEPVSHKLSNDECRNKSKAQISKGALVCDWRIRHPDLGIPSDFVICHSDLGIPVQGEAFLVQTRQPGIRPLPGSFSRRRRTRERNRILPSRRCHECGSPISDNHDQRAAIIADSFRSRCWRAARFHKRRCAQSFLAMEVGDQLREAGAIPVYVQP